MAQDTLALGASQRFVYRELSTRVIFVIIIATVEQIQQVFGEAADKLTHWTGLQCDLSTQRSARSTTRSDGFTLSWSWIHLSTQVLQSCIAAVSA